MKNFLLVIMFLCSFAMYSQKTTDFQIPRGRHEITTLGYPKNLNEGALRKIGSGVEVIKQADGKYTITNRGFIAKDITYLDLKNEVLKLLKDLNRYSARNKTLTINEDNHIKGLRANKDSRELIVLIYNKFGIVEQYLLMNLQQSKDLQDKIEKAVRDR